MAMQRRRRLALALGLSVGFCLAPAQRASAAPVLTGAVQFAADPSGGLSPAGQFWNTLASDTIFNLYLTQPNTGITGPFLNSGDTNPATRINVTLTPGSYTFYMFGQPVLTNLDNFGLNLFFNANDINPGISAFVPIDLAPSPPFPAFSPNASNNTPRLTVLVTTPGAGSLTFTDGEFTVTLTEYRWSALNVENLDRVQAFNNVPGGGNDFVGQFTLVVTGPAAVVPEPSGGALIGLGVAGLLGYRWRTRKRPAA